MLWFREPRRSMNAGPVGDHGTGSAFDPLSPWNSPNRALNSRRSKETARSRRAHPLQRSDG